MTGTRRRPPALTGDPVVPRPAATVVLVRPGHGELEVLLTLRPSTMAFAGGMMVFPGGRVDPGDSDTRLTVASGVTAARATERLGGGIDGADALAAHHAAIRELFEEAGILLASGSASAADIVAGRQALLDGTTTLADLTERLGITLDLDAIIPIGRWVTPAAYARRFDARFFAAALPDGAEPTFTGDEVAGHRWTTPSAALAAMAEREIEMWIPTSSTLQRLRGIASIVEVCEQLALPSSGWQPPRVERLADDHVQVTCWTAGGAPGRQVETRIVGRRELTVLDPGDPSPEALTAIVQAAASFGGGSRIVAVVLSSAEPYVAAGADELSERTGAAVYGPPGTQRELPFPVSDLTRGAIVPAGDVGVVISPD